MGFIFNMFRKVRLLEEKNDKLRKELREADEINYKKSEKIADLTNELERIRSEYSRMQDKANALEEELNILKSERKEIGDKTKDGIDKDAVITQLILEKDRLAIENLKYHTQLIAKDRAAIEIARINSSRFMYQIPMPYNMANCNCGLII